MQERYWSTIIVVKNTLLSIVRDVENYSAVSQRFGGATLIGLTHVHNFVGRSRAQHETLITCCASFVLAHDRTFPD